MTTSLWALTYVLVGLVVYAVDWYVNEDNIYKSAREASAPFGEGAGRRLYAASLIVFALVICVATWPVYVIRLALNTVRCRR